MTYLSWNKPVKKNTEKMKSIKITKNKQESFLRISFAMFSVIVGISILFIEGTISKVIGLIFMIVPFFVFVKKTDEELNSISYDSEKIALQNSYEFKVIALDELKSITEIEKEDYDIRANKTIIYYEWDFEYNQKEFFKVKLNMKSSNPEMKEFLTLISEKNPNVKIYIH